MFSTIFLGLMYTMMALCFVMLIRNNMVYRYRTEMVRRISAASKQNLLDEWMWRYDEFDAVPYGDMVFKFWKPLKSFYPRDPARGER